MSTQRLRRYPFAQRSALRRMLAQNIRLLPLPPYAPECNPVEHVWDELREKFFHNEVFDSLDALEDQLELALKTYEDDHATIKSIDVEMELF
jgi:transposase